MFLLTQKPFVSLVFTNKKLQILQLNPKKNEVLKHTELALPEGLVGNHKILDKNLLVQILREAWEKLNLEEKSVGIVIPEFSTFSKILNLPQLKIKEIDEAVRWQAEDFLPFSSDQMVLDWRIIGKENNNYQILVVAIPKDTLESFTEAVVASGFYPLVVETPSLALTRISKERNEGRLIIYLNSEEAIIVLAVAEKIISTSVINAQDQLAIINTVFNMINHYQEIRIEKLLIGGLGFTQELIDNLQKNTQLTPNWLQLPIKGLTAEEIQNYLIALSLQFKDPAEPRDENTINLASPEWLEIYQNNRLKNQLFALLVFSSFVLFICLISSFLFFLSFEKKISDLKKSGEVEALIPQELVNKVEEINKLSQKVISLKSSFLSPSLIINAVVKAKPGGIIINSYRLDLDTGKIFLKGTAADRDALIKLKQNLEENKNFSKANIPISALAAEQNINFEIDFRWQEEKKEIIVPIE